MTNAVLTTGHMEKNRAAGLREHLRLLLGQFWFAVLAYSSLVIFALIVFHVPGATDYVGKDNDDTMRLVEVRDLLAGQGWFDTMQYRLGLEGGTLMHWSRLIDLPIANLISFFDIFLGHERAEAVALIVWPMTCAAALLAAMALAGRRIGGVTVMHAALGLTVMLLLTSNRFLPGSIDHHNVQLVLVALMTAMLVDPRRRPASFAMAGLAAALAMAIGAETAPHVAIVSIIVACLWAWHGAPFARAARAYSIALIVAVSAAFFLTVPPHLYSVVTCDSLSLGFYGLSSVGAVTLFLSAQIGSNMSFRGRVVVLAADGLVVAACALLLAPQCLSNPLGNLDPTLVKLWLNNVGEAQSLLVLSSRDPASLGGVYATGLMGIAICLFRILRRDKVEAHAILLTILLVSWAVAAVQVRGAVFSSLVAILPLSMLIMDLRRIANRDPENMGAGFCYAVMALLSVPAIWALGGLAGAEGIGGLLNHARAETESGPGCSSKTALAQLAGLDRTVVAASSELGVHILRHTPHRALSAPYHRNQGGMLTEIYVGLSKPPQAEAFLRGAGVTILAYCPTDAQTRSFAKLEPDGLYAQLQQGKLPGYLAALPKPDDSGLQLYRVMGRVD